MAPGVGRCVNAPVIDTVHRLDARHIREFAQAFLFCILFTRHDRLRSKKFALSLVPQLVHPAGRWLFVRCQPLWLSLFASRRCGMSARVSRRHLRAHLSLGDGQRIFGEQKLKFSLRGFARFTCLFCSFPLQVFCSTRSAVSCISCKKEGLILRNWELSSSASRLCCADLSGGNDGIWLSTKSRHNAIVVVHQRSDMRQSK